MEQQNTEAEIEQLKKITRQDNAEKYAEAQFELGRIYYEYKKDWQKAIKHLLNIKKQDNPNIYANAQLNLGVIYQNKQDIERAEQCYLKVEKQDNPELYAVARLILGDIYRKEKNDIEKAEHCYLKIEKQDNPKAYANAQFKLGSIYQYKKQDIKQAEQYYLHVEKKDNPKRYADAQLNLGRTYQYTYNNFEQAERYYLNIKKQDSPKAYAIAQFSLGNIYKKYNIKKAEHYYLNIEKQDNPELYAAAQLKLGNIYREEKNDIKKSERYYLKVEKEDSPKAYALAQCKLGDNVFFNKMQNKLKSSEEYYQNVAYSDNSFQSYIIAQVMLSVISNKHSSIFEEKQRDELVVKICDIRKLTLHIQKELLVDFNLNESKNINGLVFERQVAHYTKPEVLFNLLKNKPSDFRLNVVDFMNDPTENQVLTDWLNVKTEKENEIKTFLASFSFNHNSLNQFRLYGNENNIVGSSVSVIFNKKFFGDDINRSINPASINYFFNNTDFGLARNDSAKNVVATMGINDLNESLNQKIYQTENDLNENLDQKNSEIVEEKNIISSVGSLPLFRCLYFDPENRYISFAKRNKYSFYLEHQDDNSENIDKKWNKYLKLLEEEQKITIIREKLNQIQDIICKLKKSNKLKKIINLDKLIALALMPISCLVKHAAFEDEDECRIIYITNIDDKNVQAPNDYAFINRLYLNYSNVEGYIEKIYLGPRCQSDPELWITNRAQTLKSNLTNEPIKVMKSQMPLR